MTHRPNYRKNPHARLPSSHYQSTSANAAACRDLIDRFERSRSACARCRFAVAFARTSTKTWIERLQGDAFITFLTNFAGRVAPEPTGPQLYPVVPLSLGPYAYDPTRKCVSGRTLAEGSQTTQGALVKTIHAHYYENDS